MNSMTGYGRSAFRHKNHEIIVEVSTVNKRNFEAAASLPKEWQALESPLLRIARKSIERGRLRLSVRPEKDASGTKPTSTWDEAALEAELEGLETFALNRGIPFEPNAEILARLATTTRRDLPLPSSKEVEPPLLSAAEEAVSRLAAMRAVEGAELAKDLKGRLDALDGMIDELDRSTENVAVEWRDKLLERLRKADLAPDLDDERVLKEVSLFADKADVSEELTRLRSHIAQFRESLASTEPVGRKLEFLLQEFSRELNTLCSKSTRAESTRIALDARNEVEKIREQALNVE